eukprot:TRINITY_DN23456_c0_g1_i1.p1 TRINITY_DN23456_c0_g1~~TRINITY_DN23456_c0_g1_i1.p1  ORF type:complete len:596 (+),score=67.07 TRINITY_DN23456_c0_g1_i1:20-1807(+)
MTGGMRVVAIGALGDNDAVERGPLRASGLALSLSDGFAVVLTMADLPTGDLSVAFTSMDQRAVSVGATLVASVSVTAAVDAFRNLSTHGWSCGRADRFMGASRTGLTVKLLRTTERFSDGCRDLQPASQALWDGTFGHEVVGAAVRVVSAPFSAPAGDCVATVVSRGVLSNVSSPTGLLLLDARCVEASAGGAVVLETSVSDSTGQADCIVACMAPTLRSASKENIAFSVAVPLKYLIEALLADDTCAEVLGNEHLARSHARKPALRPFPSCAAAQATADARCGVVLLWLESTGSWASAVVVSEAGHLLTCAHLLTGRSWMEVPPEELQASQEKKSDGAAAASRPPARALPKKCRARGHVRGSDGYLREFTFDAEVLHVFEGYLDVAILVASSSTARSSAGSRPVFSPLRWGNTPREGTNVCAVGFGLFGPGAPWRGPSVTCGEIVKVSWGSDSKRPAVIQSTAAVHRGCSGGALIDATTQTLVGLVTTNVKQHDGGVMPHVNFSLPISLLRPVLEYFAGSSRHQAIEAERAGAWRATAEADAQERSLWRLEPEPLDLPSRVEERTQQALDAVRRLSNEAEEAEASETPAVRSAL